MGGDAAVIVAGIGCRLGCPAGEIVALVERACAQAGLRPDLLAAPDSKLGDAGLRDAAARLSVPLHLVASDALASVQTSCATFSARVARHAGIASVAEAAALVAAGPGSRLLLPRIASGRATCALAVA